MFTKLWIVNIFLLLAEKDVWKRPEIVVFRKDKIEIIIKIKIITIDKTTQQHTTNQWYS